MRHLLRLAVLRGTNLPIGDLIGSSDAFVEFKIDGCSLVQKTGIITSLNPEWRHIFFHDLTLQMMDDPTINLNFTVWDADFRTNDILGVTHLLLSEITRTSQHNEVFKKTLPLDGIPESTIDIIAQILRLDSVYPLQGINPKEIDLTKADFSQFKNLAMEGGGVKGFAYRGAIELFEQCGILQNIERVSGTSAGAINAIILALGSDAKQFAEVVQSSDVRKFVKSSSWSESLDVIKVANEFGWYSGAGFISELELMLEKMLEGVPGYEDHQRRKDLNFLDLHELAISQPVPGKKFRDAHIIGSNLSTGRWEVFDYIRRPTMQIKIAIRISMSIPFFFSAVNFDSSVWVDGGLCNNYPVQVFDDLKFIKDDRYCSGHDSHPFNKQTIGLRVDPVSSIYGVSSEDFPVHHQAINSLGSFSSSLVNFVLENSQPLSAQDRDRTIFINEENIAATNFDISEEDKMRLHKNGKKYTKAYLKWFATGNAKFMKVEFVKNDGKDESILGRHKNQQLVGVEHSNLEEDLIPGKVKHHHETIESLKVELKKAKHLQMTLHVVYASVIVVLLAIWYLFLGR